MAITAPLLWVDGSVVSADAASVALMSHAVQRGSLVFDVGSFHATPRGPALFRAAEHVDRLLASAKLVGLTTEYDRDALLRAAIDVVAQCGRDEGLVRWSLYFTAKEPDLVPRDAKAHAAVAVQLLQDPPRSEPLRIAVFDDARKAPPEALSPKVKASAAYLGPMMARRRAIAEGHDDVVLLDRDGFIAEAPIANVMLIDRDGALVTPPLDYVLAGITRDAVIAIARHEGIAVREEPVSLEALLSADEVFLTATSLPLGAVGAVNGKPIRSAPGPATKRLAAKLDDAQHARGETWRAWLTFVR